jgi:prepilin-type processing-associated H-X9-DG protein
MLLPSLASAKLKSVDLKCVNNSKEMLLSMIYYSDDANGQLISYRDPHSTASDLWISRLDKNYEAAQAIRCCPATTPPNPVSAWRAPNDDPLSWGTADYPWLWSGDIQFVGSYGINGYCYSDGYAQGFGQENQYYKKVSNVFNAAMTPYFTDSIWVDGWPSETDTPARDLYAGGDGDIGIDRLTIARHGYRAAGAAPKSVPAGAPLVGAINAGFIDGHVAPVKLEKLWTLYWHAGWKTPATRPR